MATTQFNAPLGADKTKVVVIVGGAIGGSGVQLTIDNAVCKSKLEAISAISVILQRVQESNKYPLT